MQWWIRKYYYLRLRMMVASLKRDVATTTRYLKRLKRMATDPAAQAAIDAAAATMTAVGEQLGTIGAELTSLDAWVDSLAAGGTVDTTGLEAARASLANAAAAVKVISDAHPDSPAAPPAA